MKKLLAAAIVVMLGLTGCSAMGDMEEVYNQFITTRDANGYTLVTEDLEDGTKIEYDYVSATEYNIVYQDSTSDMTMTCGDEATASVDLEGYDSISGTEAVEYCDLMNSTIQTAASEVYENEAFFNTEYDVEYAKTDTGFSASGVYDESTEAYTMTLTADGTVLTFEDATQTMTVTTK